MTEKTRATLIGQFEIASQLAHYHLDTLTTEECLWQPAPRGLHVHLDTDGRWIADWPDREDYSIGPASVAWITWHIGFWWSMVLDHSFGEGTLEREAVFWPGSAESTIAWIADLETRWRAEISAMPASALESATRTRWPFTDRPFAEVIAWATLELTKNAAEIGYARFLRGACAEDHRTA